MALDERFGRQLKSLADTLLTSSFLLAVLLAGSLSSAQSAPAANPAPAKLRSETVAAFDRYVHLTQERNETELTALVVKYREFNRPDTNPYLLSLIGL